MRINKLYDYNESISLGNKIYRVTNEYSNFNKRKIATFYYFLAQKIG